MKHLFFHYWGRSHLEPLYSSLPSQFFQSAQNRLLVTFTPIKSRNKVIILRSRRLEVVGTTKKTGAHPSRASLASVRSLFHPLLPSACYAGCKVLWVLSLALALFYIKLDICFFVLRTFMLRVRLVFPFSLMPWIPQFLRIIPCFSYACFMVHWLLLVQKICDIWPHCGQRRHF